MHKANGNLATSYNYSIVDEQDAKLQVHAKSGCMDWTYMLATALITVHSRPRSVETNFDLDIQNAASLFI